MDKKLWKREEAKINEQRIRELWSELNLHQTKVDFTNKNKFFATFPYPYMNGYLHLGHGFTMSTYDFMSRFYRMCGYDVLQPFSFHLTGMPIMASADNLKEDFKLLESGTSTDQLKPDSQYNIMLKMEFTESEMKSFVDPRFWGTFFSEKAKQTLKKLGISYDPERSFVTTDADPYYDRFIKWQFMKLYEKNVLNFGTRYDLFSIKNNQPCSGSDRSAGEDAVSVKSYLVPLKVINFDRKNILTSCNQSLDSNIEIKLIVIVQEPHNVKCVTMNTKKEHDVFRVEYTDKLNSKLNCIEYWICAEYNLVSLKHQNRKEDPFYLNHYEKVGTVLGSYLEYLSNGSIQSEPVTILHNIKITGIATSLHSDNIAQSELLTEQSSGNNYHDIYQLIEYYEPDKEAYSRSGDKLIVSKMDQWFIDYGSDEWKKKVHAHIDTMTFNDETVRNSLHIATDWLDKWPCSRTYGLGTVFPEEIESTNKSNLVHKIDSLSDSTIYQALYTVYHLFAKLNIQPEELTYDVFDYVFLLKGTDKDYLKFKPLQDEFLHWYPFDLRVSGKDLLNNHLTMCIFNHLIIWDDEFHDKLTKLLSENKCFAPRRYNINGYITVQKSGSKEVEKMSKSKGNFKTLDQALDMYTADSLRFTFASASTGVDDAFFDQELCTRMIEKLHKTKDLVVKTLENIDLSVESELSYLDKMYRNEMMFVVKDTMDAYKRMDMRAVVTSGFHVLFGVYDSYFNVCKNNKMVCNSQVLKEFVQILLTLMNPIIPHICYDLSHSELYFKVYGTNELSIDSIINYSLNLDYNLRWTYDYLQKVSSDINKRVLSLNKKKKVKTVSIYSASKIIDPNEQLAYSIFISEETDPILKDSMQTLTKSDADLAKIRDMCIGVPESEKTMNLVIRRYKHIEKLVEKYGKQWLTSWVNREFIEACVLSDYLGWYISDHTYLLQITDVDDLSDIFINEPVIRYSCS